MSVTKITKDNYKSEVLESEMPVILDFWASWCGPCRALSPIIDELSNEHSEIKFGKVNVDEEGELANEFKIMSIPSVFVIKGGKVVNQSSGVMPKSQILAMLK